MNKSDNKDINTIPPQQYYYPPYAYPQDDEVNLMDILRILTNKKKQIIATFLVITFVGCIYGLLKPDLYNYSDGFNLCGWQRMGSG